MISVVLMYSELESHRACDEGMALFRAVGRMQWSDVAEPPCVVVPRWTVLHTVWLAVAVPSFYGWLRERGLIPGPELIGANLDGANLDGANLRRANLDGANLDGANLRRANLRGADLTRANLYGANLRRANLCGADLYGAYLENANLRGANLRGANLDGANLYGANLDGANRSRLDTPVPSWVLVDGRLRRKA